MVLTWSQYENMSKEELIQELTDIKSSFVNDINTKLSNLGEKFNDFLLKYDNVNSELQQSKKFSFTDKNNTTRAQCCDKFPIQ